MSVRQLVGKYIYKEEGSLNMICIDLKKTYNRDHKDLLCWIIEKWQLFVILK